MCKVGVILVPLSQAVGSKALCTVANIQEKLSIQLDAPGAATLSGLSFPSWDILPRILSLAPSLYICQLHVE